MTDPHTPSVSAHITMSLCSFLFLVPAVDVRYIEKHTRTYIQKLKWEATLEYQ